ncbi:MAG: ComEC/Rec2 family competence protein, partial [Candidatus Omnitrophica bacterium]|nr:ComEC/Rec2 family competence protein [Candidatus Omnitrophota bacterium]
MKLSIPGLTAIFAFGIYAAGLFKPRFEFFYSAGVLFLIFSLFLFKRKNIFIVCLCISLFALGAAALKNFKFLAGDHISNFAYYQNDSVYSVSGAVKSEPAREGAQSKFLLEATTIEHGRAKYNCRGLVLVKLNYPPDLFYGDEIVLTGSLYRPYKSLEVFSYRDYLARQGIYCLMSVKLAKLKRHRFSFTKAALSIKNKMEKIISGNLSSEAAGIMLAMVLG